MFTGVIHHFGKITACDKAGDWRITVEHDLPDKDIKTGDSIACNGCCLTVIEKSGGRFSAQLSQETLDCTAANWDVGATLHLERAMRLGETLDGHMVSGHVDGLATLLSIAAEKDSHRLEFEAPQELSRFIAAKGSVALNGVSLTVNRVSSQRFTVNVIPHTWKVTGFSDLRAGDKVNLEIDLIARYAARLLGT